MEKLLKRCCQSVMVAACLAHLFTPADATVSNSSLCSWSKCSRTCGGGISVQKCACHNDSQNEMCTRSKTQYQMCNIQDCPDEVDFRILQCSAYDSVPYKGKLYKWTSFSHGSAECELKCMPKSHRFFVTFDKKVVDGTRCNEETHNVCVDGACLPVGCDMRLHSNATLDACGECKGDGSSCKKIAGSEVLTSDAFGYIEIVSIPVGSTSIRIYEVGTPKNYITIEDGAKLLLHGDYKVSNTGFYKFNGLKVKYERASINQVTIAGPTPTKIIIKVLVVAPAEIRYEFYTPLSAPGRAVKAEYVYRVDTWDSCSKECAGGFRLRNVSCVRADIQEVVPDFHCKGLPRPIQREVCNAHPCAAGWYISQWSPCSKTCGVGQHTRRVQCVQSVNGGEVRLLDFSQCPGSMPHQVEECTVKKTCPQWTSGEWSDCSSSCGEGAQNREVRCVESENSVEEESCSADAKPATRRVCLNAPCGASWRAGDWEQCSASCGVGMRSRPVICQDVEGKAIPNELCPAELKPAHVESCHAVGTCKPKWHGSQWSRCTGRCGYGIQTRLVVCAEKAGVDKLLIVNESLCDNSTRLPHVRVCQEDSPCYVNYFVSEWRPCSSSCGYGYQQRDVTCYADMKVDHTEGHCRRLQKPQFVRLCHQAPCEAGALLTTIPHTTILPATEVHAAAPRITSFSGPEQLHVGDNADYQCSFTGHPQSTVSWELNGQPLLDDRFQVLRTKLGSRLVLLAAAPEDNGLLECVVNSSSGSDRSGVQIQTSGPPVVEVRPESALHREGDAITVLCSAAGKPSPQVSWQKDDVNFNGDLSRVIVTPGKIFIRRALLGDSGKYRCLASSSAGTASALATVTVERMTEVGKVDCVDNPALASCSIIRSIGFCSHHYYRNACCRSCRSSA